jgi:hypothetical protein
MNAYIDEITRLRCLAGIPADNSASLGSNISATGTELARIQRERNIRPGTPEWFRLWFAKTLLTGEKPV